MNAYLVSKYKRPMQAGEGAEPTVGDRDLLVDVHAAGVNMLDAKIRDGEFKLLLPYKTPFILGHDLAGVVTRVGSAVTRFGVGDEVYARVRDGHIGTFAQRIAVHEDDLALKPTNLSMAEAASVPTSSSTTAPRTSKRSRTTTTSSWTPKAKTRSPSRSGSSSPEGSSSGSPAHRTRTWPANSGSALRCASFWLC
jgi:NADPH:quinone reductase-like Zn-dependent oxidoreductase